MFCKVLGLSLGLLSGLSMKCVFQVPHQEFSPQTGEGLIWIKMMMRGEGVLPPSTISPACDTLVFICSIV